MIDIDLAARARLTILACASGDTQGRLLSSSQPALFDAEPRLSPAVWYLLSTCEAVARSGGGVNAGMVASVLQEWRAGGRLHGTAVGAGDAMLHIAPLAFVVDPDNTSDRLAVAEMVSATWPDDQGPDDVQAILTTLRTCLENGRVADSRLSTGSPVAAMPLALDRALSIAAEHPDDLESAFAQAATQDDAARVAALTGLLLGISGCEVPKRLLDTLPQRAEVEAVIEPFAQLIAAAAG